MLLIHGVVASATKISLDNLVEGIWLKMLPVFRHPFPSLAAIFSNPFLRVLPRQEPVARSSVVPAGHRDWEPQLLP